MIVRDKKLAKYINWLEAHRRKAISGELDMRYTIEDVFRKVEKRLGVKNITEIQINEDDKEIAINCD
jgi:hypothetical protein